MASNSTNTELQCGGTEMCIQIITLSVTFGLLGVLGCYLIYVSCCRVKKESNSQALSDPQVPPRAPPPSPLPSTPNEVIIVPSILYVDEDPT
jgi:hypothetical protein